MIAADETPTEALDLRRDGLMNADAALLVALEKIVYLRDLACICSRFGYEMPYTIEELKPLHSALRDLAGRVRQEQEGV